MKKMKVIKRVYSNWTLFLCGFLMVSQSTLADEKPATPALSQNIQPSLSADTSKTALLNSQRIMEGSAAFKNAMGEMELKRKEIEKEFEKTQASLEKESNALVALRSTLPENKFMEKKKSFDQKVIKLQNTAQERRRELEMMYQNAVGQLHQGVQKILADLGKKHRFLLVVEQQMVLWNAPEILDVTDEVIQELNKSLKKISLS